MRNNKGITLVALVITIIVLLILAGVSIAALGGQNGILTNATKARQEDAIGSQRDTVAMAINEATNAYYAVTYAGASKDDYEYTTGAGTGTKVGTQYQTAVNFIKDATYTANQDAEAKGGAAKVEVDVAPLNDSIADTEKVVRIVSTDDNPIYIEAILNDDGSLGTWTSSEAVPESGT